MRKVMLAGGMAAVGLLAVGCDSATPKPATNSAKDAAAGAQVGAQMSKDAAGKSAPTSK